MSQADTDQHTADQWQYHMGVIRDTMAKWAAGQINTFTKRRAIADENSRYYGAECPAHLTRTGRRYELPAILAETVGVDEDVMVIALNMRREGGVQAYNDVLAAAGVRRYQSLDPIGDGT